MKLAAAHPATYRIISSSGLPRVLQETSLSELCKLAGIEERVTGGHRPRILLVESREHFLVPEGYGIPSSVARGAGPSNVARGAGPSRKLTRTGALRILESLAYVFLDYAARECVCGRGLFGPSTFRGPPPEGGRAKTAAERVRAYRARRKVKTTGGSH